MLLVAVPEVATVGNRSIQVKVLNNICGRCKAEGFSNTESGGLIKLSATELLFVPLLYLTAAASLDLTAA